MRARRARVSWWTRDIRNVTILWAIVSVILIIATLAIAPNLYGLPATAAERTSDYNLTMMVFTVMAMPIFALVIVFALYSLFQWRSPGRPARDGIPLIAGPGIQLVWVLVSSFLVLLLYAWGLIFLNRADAAPPPSANVLTVYVTGEQWNWDFTYPQYGDAQSPELYVPINRPVLFKITSIDVTHSFSVPAWALKEDAVPGNWTYIRVTPNQMGTFPVRCYELCGLFHSYMETQAHVVSASDFSTWVGNQPTGYPWGIGGSGVPGQYPDGSKGGSGG